MMQEGRTLTSFAFCCQNHTNTAEKQ